ncbi:MAG: ABC transporter permease, partial [Proteobacteria bacterium]|nr:ABC transporter permease [Pseudomonadota bacterium]
CCDVAGDVSMKNPLTSVKGTLISGLIIWNDRRHGMFEQIMSGPYTRMQYILANICTIGIIGMASAALIAVVGLPVFLESVEFSPPTVPVVVFASVVGSVLFGSLASIISTRLNSSEGFNVVINTTFIFLAFSSTAFYPAEGAPEALSAAFYVNPLTYLVDTIRAGMFGGVTEMVMVEMGVLTAIALTLFAVAAKMMTRLDF